MSKATFADGLGSGAVAGALGAGTGRDGGDWRKGHGKGVGDGSRRDVVVKGSTHALRDVNHSLSPTLLPEKPCASSIAEPWVRGASRPMECALLGPLPIPRVVLVPMVAQVRPRCQMDSKVQGRMLHVARLAERFSQPRMRSVTPCAICESRSRYADTVRWAAMD